MKLSNDAYDKLKFVATTLLPALVTLIGTIGSQLGYDMTTPVVILTALNTFMGTMLGMSSLTYNAEKGE